MKRLFLLPFLFTAIVFPQVISSMTTWENILQTPELVEYFRGIFNHLGITIEETGESFTIHHTGEGFKFEKGINKDNVDFIVPVKLQNIQNMVNHAKDGKINADESWRILDVLFTPMTKVTLQTPVSVSYTHLRAHET